MSDRLLLTGATGFIGSNVARILINKKTGFTALIRPNTSPKRLDFLVNNAEIVKLDLADTGNLRTYLNQEKFDTIIHIGALRGGRKYAKRVYYDANVKATEQIAEAALKNESKLVFCSSVGVYGAIPQELPATINTKYQSDNVYHDTKIKAEGVIQKYVLAGLKAVIIRPAITYGENDYGFPYTLVKLVHRKLLLLPDITKIIHLANIDIVADAFYKVPEDEYRGNKIYNIADRYPGQLDELVDFISNRLYKRDYPGNRYISVKFFRRLARFAQRHGLHNFHNRIKLISNSWFYDNTESFKDLYLRHAKTIPDFKVVIDWYKKIHRIK